MRKETNEGGQREARPGFTRAPSQALWSQGRENQTEHPSTHCTAARGSLQRWEPGDESCLLSGLQPRLEAVPKYTGGWQEICGIDPSPELTPSCTFHVQDVQHSPLGRLRFS